MPSDERAPEARVSRQVAVYDDGPSRSWLGIALLLTLLVGGTSAGTWAAFSASTSNNASFATGALVLQNTVVARDGIALADPPACDSTDDGDTTVNSSTCTALFSVDPQVVDAGATATAVVELENLGSLDAGSFEMHADGACADAPAAASTFHGASSLCGALTIEVAELPRGCVATSDTCPETGIVAAHSLATFSSEHGSFNTAEPLGQLETGARRSFLVSISLPAVGDLPQAINSYQGRQASFGLTWRITT